MRPVDRLRTALGYPWNGGESGLTLVVGGVLTLLSPLVLPGLLVLGYLLRVAEAVLEERASPPGFEDPGGLFVDGLKAAAVILAYVVVPLAVAAPLLAAVAGAAGFRFAGPLTPGRVAATGALGVTLLLLLAALVLVLFYVIPAPLLHLARTRRLGAAFAVGDVRRLVRADAYAAAWLLALVVFAGTAVVLAVLDAAVVGAIVSGFVSFYAFVAMAHLYASGARAVGFGVERAEGTEAAPPGPDRDA